MFSADRAASSGQSQSSFAPRLFSPSDDDPRDPLEMTLREAFSHFLAPSIDSSQTATLTSYRNALNHWELFTPNPPLRSISSQTLLDFRGLLEGAPLPDAVVLKIERLPERRRRRLKLPLAPNTVAKVLRTLRPILRRCGPPTDRNPRRKAILATIPWVESPHVGRKAPRTATNDEIDRLYDACRVAVWPQVSHGEIPAPAFWRALVVSFYTLGPRAWEILHDGSSEKIGWFWDKLVMAGTSSRGTQLSAITFVQPKTGNELRLPVGPVLIAHLESIRSDRRAIFPVTLAHGSVYNQWRAIKAAAGVGVEGSQDLDFHDFRRTCQTEWDWIKLGLGDWILGHAAQDVGGRHYRNFERHAFEECENLPQPQSFQTIFNRFIRERQGRLF